MYEDSDISGNFRAYFSDLFAEVNSISNQWNNEGKIFNVEL